jgi:hypothetical protein
MMVRKLVALGVVLFSAACSSASNVPASASPSATPPGSERGGPATNVSAAPYAPASAEASAPNTGHEEAPPQAAPFLDLLRAAKTSDVIGFKAAYAKRIREDASQSDWQKNVSEARDNLKKAFGDYEARDFAFTYAGDASKGVLSIAHKKDKPLALKVIAEDGDWKIDER